MGGRAPKLSQVGVAVAFAFSCFGLLLFLWAAFGGPVPFAPAGYRVKVPFKEGTQLAVESDVRISNVSVGKVKAIELDTEGEDAGTATATIEIDSSVAPIPEDTRAILRQKTLLGEAYVELTPGDEQADSLPEDATLPRAQVSDAVQLDEIFRTFDARTRAAFQTWQQSVALALDGRGADLSAALANLEPFAADATRLLRVLDTQSGAVRGLVRNAGEVFAALSERQGQLSSLIVNTNTVFSTTARRDQDLEATFIALPTFLRESRATLTRLDTFATDSDPLIQQLRPAARQLSDNLINIAKVSPDLVGFFKGLRRVETNSVQGLPALRDFIDNQLPPLLAQADPFTQQFTPILQAANLYRREIASLLGNLAAASNAPQPSTLGPRVKVLRTSSTLNPETLAAYPAGVGRLQSNRPNPYVQPNGALKIKTGLEVFENRQCAGGTNATITNGGGTPLSTDVFNRVKEFAFADQNSTTTLPRPGCVKQATYSSIGAIPELTDYLHVYALP
jgi:virulence factor Mce-like protein